MFEKISRQALFATALLLVCAAYAQVPDPLAPPPGPRMILTDVMVTNDKGPVRGLNKNDFSVEDKGKKQTISLFGITESGKLKIPATPLPAGIYTNRLNNKGEIQGTATVLLFDRANSDAGDQAFVRGQILKVLGALKDTDRLGFSGLGFKLQVIRDYNEDAAPLAKAARALQQGSTAPANFTAEEKEVFNGLTEALAPMQQLQPQARVNITYPAFRQVSRHLTGVEGRKNVIWISSEFPLTYGNDQARKKNDEAEVEAFKNVLLESNIVLFPIDPAGAGGSFNQTAEGAPTANEGSLMKGSMRNSTNTGSFTTTDSSLMGTQTFLNLANATGGQVYRNVNDISPELKEVLSAAEYTYTLGFYPDEKTLDSKNHDIKITVKDTKLKPTYRKQYFAWGPATPQGQKPGVAIEELIADSLNATGIGMMAVANPAPDKPGAQVLDVRLTAADVRFDQTGDKFSPDFDVVIVSDNGKQRGTKTYTPALTADQMKVILEGGLNLSETLEPGAPGGYFRIVAIDKKTGATGSLMVAYGTAKPGATQAK
jgi:VWFA-related protein